MSLECTCCIGLVYTLFRAENVHWTNTLLGRIDNKKADDFMTSGKVVIRFEVIKCLRSEILLYKNYSDEKVQFLDENRNMICIISIAIHGL